MQTRHRYVLEIIMQICFVNVFIVSYQLEPELASHIVQTVLSWGAWCLICTQYIHLAHSVHVRGNSNLRLGYISQPHLWFCLHLALKCVLYRIQGLCWIGWRQTDRQTGTSLILWEQLLCNTIITRWIITMKEKQNGRFVKDIKYLHYIHRKL